MDKHRSKVATDDSKGIAEAIADKITGHQRIVAEGRLLKQAGRIRQAEGVVRDTPRSR